MSKEHTPAPSVIEAGDAIADRLRSLTKDRDWDDTISVLEEWDQAKASRPSVTAPVIAWHKAGEFPPAQIPEGHILIGYSNRVGKDEDYSLRQLACYPDKGPWTDWYGAVPNPDHWAIIPVPDKDIARWHMPKRATPQGVTVDQIMEVVGEWLSQGYHRRMSSKKHIDLQARLSALLTK